MEKAPPAPTPTPGKGDGQSELPVHVGVRCNGCGQEPIVGTRFKCLVCKDWNLCSACDAKGVHSEHTFVQIQIQTAAVGEWELQWEDHYGEMCLRLFDSTEHPLNVHIRRRVPSGSVTMRFASNVCASQSR
mmetsp:Transcript_25471/g.41918  ORF Transcript_25471/g.41918 Transcript_25471/m.41918 type:complete len:131 (-) Transcript_25471:2827-3219(-)